MDILLACYALPLAEERDALRDALRECVVAAGGCASPEVSTEFLLRTPIEVRALAAEVARLRAELVESRSFLLADEERSKLTGDALHAEGEMAAACAMAARVRDEAGDHPGAVAAMPAPLRRAILDLLTALGAKEE